MAIPAVTAAQETVTGIGPQQPIIGIGAPISTEISTILFQLGVGTVLGLGGLIAAQRLSAVGDDIPTGAVVPAVAVASLGIIAGAFLLPSG